MQFDRLKRRKFIMLGSAAAASVAVDMGGPSIGKFATLHDAREALATRR
jgi:hypothetical protein